jgi:hypothetical protein
MSAPCTTLQLSGAELRLLRNALETYLSAFGHDEHEFIDATRLLLARLDNAGTAHESTKAAG